jgi:hypothetical protein
MALLSRVIAGAGSPFASRNEHLSIATWLQTMLALFTVRSPYCWNAEKLPPSGMSRVPGPLTTIVPRLCTIA